MAENYGRIIPSTFAVNASPLRTTFTDPSHGKPIEDHPFPLWTPGHLHPSCHSVPLLPPLPSPRPSHQASARLIRQRLRRSLDLFRNQRIPHHHSAFEGTIPVRQHRHNRLLSSAGPSHPTRICRIYLRHRCLDLGRYSYCSLATVLARAHLHHGLRAGEKLVPWPRLEPECRRAVLP